MQKNIWRASNCHKQCQKTLPEITYQTEMMVLKMHVEIISLQAFVEYQNEEQVEEISISSSKNVSLNLTLAWVS